MKSRAADSGIVAAVGQGILEAWRLGDLAVGVGIEAALFGVSGKPSVSRAIKRDDLITLIN